MLDGGGGGGLVGPDFNLHSTITENMPPSLLANLNIQRTHILPKNIFGMHACYALLGVFFDRIQCDDFPILSLINLVHLYFQQ